MDVGALIFMPALAASVVLGFVFLLFMCHYYLTVLESTGAGAREVTWVSEAITDHFGKFMYLGWLVGLWLGPAVFAGRALATGSATPWLGFAVPLAVLWVCFPISQLSSLSATSLWYPLVPDVFARLAQKPAVVLGFFALSAGVFAVFGMAFRWTFAVVGEWNLLFVGAPLLVASVLLYARLLGRLAFVLRYTKGLFPTKKRKKAKPVADATEAAPRAGPTPTEELPPINTPEGELMGYNILSEADAPASPKKRLRAELAEADAEEPVPVEGLPAQRPPRKPTPATAVEHARVWTDEDDESATPYGVHEAEVRVEDVAPREVIQPSAEEMRLLSRADVPKQPVRAWGAGELLSFFAQEGTMMVIVIASGMCIVTGAMVRVARAFNPAGSGE